MNLTTFYSDNSIDKSKPLLIYGRGVNCIENLPNILKAGFKIDAIFDANSNHNGTTLYEIPVYHPDAMDNYSKDSHVFISSAHQKYTITKMLENKGFSSFFYVFEYEMECIFNLSKCKKKIADLLINTKKIFRLLVLYFQSNDQRIYLMLG